MSWRVFRSRLWVIGTWSSVNWFSTASGVAAVPPEIADILIAVAAIGVPVANVSTQVLLVPTSLADILAALLARVVVPDLSRVLAELTTILTNVLVVTAELARVMADVTLIRAKVARFAMRHARVERRVRVVETLCAHEVRTSNEQGRGNGSHSDFAHGISQRRYRALAAIGVRCTYDGRTTADVKTGLEVVPMRQLFPVILSGRDGHRT